MKDRAGAQPERANSEALAPAISELARAQVELQNLFIGTACNVKRWLRIVAETKIGSHIHLLPFRNALYRIRRYFWALRLNSNSFSCTNREAALLTPA
jgi:hypothetical protein